MQGLLVVVNHYLRVYNTANLASMAQGKLKTLTYMGECRHWNFEHFVHLQVEQHEVLNGLIKYGYSRIDDGSKVHYLLAGIKTKDMDLVCIQIMANLDYANRTTSVLICYQDYIAQNHHHP